ncbi:MAG: hypothetical protein H6922_04020 [Pseudomonadaceae bacterium]|nr:hypothetical protein [Pseudomonadaceae bacterium]
MTSIAHVHEKTANMDFPCLDAGPLLAYVRLWGDPLTHNLLDERLRDMPPHELNLALRGMLGTFLSDIVQPQYVFSAEANYICERVIDIHRALACRAPIPLSMAEDVRWRLDELAFQGPTEADRHIAEGLEDTLWGQDYMNVAREACDVATSDLPRLHALTAQSICHQRFARFMAECCHRELNALMDAALNAPLPAASHASSGNVIMLSAFTQGRG